MMAEERDLKGSGIGRTTGSAMTDERIARHNEEVKAFEARLEPVISALTDEQCKEVATAMQMESIGANTIGRRMRPVLGNAWDEKQDVAAGLRIVAEAFRRHDVFDPDFNKAGGRTLEEALGPITAPGG